MEYQLLEHIGGENYAWQTDKYVKTSDTERDNVHRNQKYTTKVAIADPVRALVQMEDYFESQHEL